jgi:hypothetical protein
MFDCAAEEYERWTRHFEKEEFAGWLAALRDFMARAVDDYVGSFS